MPMTNCPICTIPAGINGTDELNLTFEITCPRCGKFNATDDFLKFVPGLKPLQIANASGWIREYRQGATLELKDWEPLESLKTPRMGEKADKLLSYLSKTYPKGGANLNSNVNVGRAEIDKPEILAVCWADDQSEVNFLFHDYLAGKNLVDSGMNKTGVRERITPAGWDYLYNRNINPDSQIGFCAMWFDASVNHIWDSAILPAIEQAGYDPKIMRKHQHNNRIDDEIIAMIRRSRFVVADFTHGDKDGARGGVYFE